MAHLPSVWLGAACDNKNRCDRAGNSVGRGAPRDGPASEHADKLMLFDRFVGSWHLGWTGRDDDWRATLRLGSGRPGRTAEYLAVRRGNAGHLYRPHLSLMPLVSGPVLAVRPRLCIDGDLSARRLLQPASACRRG